MVQLEEYREAFENIGVNVAGMTYDRLEVLADFHSESNLQYPLLSDEGATFVKAMGVLDENYAPGHRAYGIPHPGILYVSSDGTIMAKIAVPGYRSRPPFDALLEHVKGLIQ